MICRKNGKHEKPMEINRALSQSCCKGLCSISVRGQSHSSVCLNQLIVFGSYEIVTIKISGTPHTHALNAGDKNISILHLSCRTSDLQF